METDGGLSKVLSPNLGYFGAALVGGKISLSHSATQSDLFSLSPVTSVETVVKNHLVFLLNF